MAKAAWLAAVGVAMAAGPARGGQEPTLRWLESPLPNLVLRQAHDVSADGTFVVGIGGRPDTGGFVPFAWSSAEGVIELPLDVPSDHAGAVCVSTDGRTIYGAMNDEQHELNIGLMWRTEDFRTYSVETRPGTGVVRGLSRNGQYAAGYRRMNSLYEPFLMNNSAQQTWLPLPAGAKEARAMDVADNGTVVGYAYIEIGSREVPRAVLWHPDHTPEYIGPEPIDEWDFSLATAITPDARFVAGRSRLGPRWSADLGWHDPTDLDDEYGKLQPMKVEAVDISADGEMITGTGDHICCSCPNMVWEEAAAIWTASSGGNNLVEWLDVLFGYNEKGLCLLAYAQCSDDGRTIAGFGANPTGSRQPFVLTLPPPCTADTNADNLVDGRDLSLILSAYGRQTPPGLGPDLNDDGRVNGSDLSILLFNFGDPC